MYRDVGLEVLKGFLDQSEIVHLVLFRRTLDHEFIIDLILAGKRCIFVGSFFVWLRVLNVSHRNIGDQQW